MSKGESRRPPADPICAARYQSIPELVQGTPVYTTEGDGGPGEYTVEISAPRTVRFWHYCTLDPGHYPATDHAAITGGGTFTWTDTSETFSEIPSETP